jgi:hypothetical protein
VGRRVTQCVQAVKQFLKGSTESDEFALISFSDRVVPESDFTTDSGAIQAWLMGAASHGRTALLNALAATGAAAGRPRCGVCCWRRHPKCRLGYYDPLE